MTGTECEIFCWFFQILYLDLRPVSAKNHLLNSQMVPVFKFKKTYFVTKHRLPNVNQYHLMYNGSFNWQSLISVLY